MGESFLRGLTELADPRLARLGIDTLRAVLDALPIAVYLKDREGRVLFLNQGWREQFAELGAQIGKKPHEIYSKELADRIVAEDERAFAEGHSTVEATRHLPRRVRNFLVRRIVLRGTELGDLLIGICEDVTPSRDIERELSRERGISEAVLSNAEAMLMMVDAGGQVLRFNRACEQISGLAAVDVLGRFYPSLFPEASEAEASSQHLELVLSTGEPISFEAPWLAAGKEPRTVSWTWVPVRDPKGQIEHIVGTGRDVTDQRRTEWALKDSERQFRLLWERSNDGMRIIDANGMTLMVNEAYARMIGRRQDELIGQPFWRIFGSPHGEELKADWDAWNATQALPYRGQQRVERPDGTVVWLDLLISKIEVPGRETMTLSIARDITAARTHAVELEEARAAAEAASAAKTQFLANMSHELRTPMNAILGLTALVLESPLDATQYEHLETVKDSSNSLLSLLNDLLDFAKTDAGMMRLDPIPFRLRDTLDGVMRTKRLQASGTGIDVQLSLPAALPDMVIGDPLRLRQVLLNLMGNAIKFTEQGWVRLQVSEAGRSAAGSIRLRFSVQDTGIGIPADKQTVIFEPFTQADGSTTRRYGGTGLGLSISSQLVQLMGGRLECRSTAGAGSEFYFEVTFGLPEGARGRDREQGGLRILVAEDNLANRRLITGLLEREGHTVTAVHSGKDAVERASLGGFDLLLMDLQMPEMDGMTAAKAIRKVENARGTHGGIYIAAVTADTTSESRARCAESGMNGFLTKPIVREELDSVLQAARSPMRVAAAQKKAQIDVEAALERVGGDRELLHDVALLFMGEYPHSLMEIQAAIEGMDAHKLERAAHTLKGSVANFGAAATVDTAFQIENLARQGDFQAAAEALQRLESTLHDLMPELERL